MPCSCGGVAVGVHTMRTPACSLQSAAFRSFDSPLQCRPRVQPSFAFPAVISLGGPDNTRRPFAGGCSPPRSLRAIAEAVRSACHDGHNTILLVGGEPTLRSELPSVVRWASRRGVVAGLLTNGRMLVYKQVRDAWLASGLGFARVELHAARATVHNELAGVPCAFEQTTQGAQELLAEAPAGFALQVACTVTQANLAELGALARWLASWPKSSALSVHWVVPPSDAAGDWQTEAAEAVHNACSVAASVGLRASFEGLAACMMGPYAALCDERARFASVYGEQERAPALVRETARTRRWLLCCHECTHQLAGCRGVPVAVHAGEAKVQARAGRRANCFNYTYERTLASARPSDACALAGHDLGGAPERLVLLQGRKHLALYRCTSRDFLDEHIRWVKDDLEQLYLDTSDAAALGDFGTSLRRVRLHEGCRGCARRVRSCPGLYEVESSSPFDDDERWLTEQLGNLRGRVLDVGCGEQPYRRLLGELTDAGTVDYHGLDPDEGALNRLRASIRGTLHAAAIEQWPAPAGWFDAVLAIRSVNHFADLHAALSTMTRALRPGGVLVLCDSPPFALLRTAEQVRYADRHAHTGQEHYRNFTSQQVLEALSRQPLRLEQHRPVSRNSCNQWMVRLVRS